MKIASTWKKLDALQEVPEGKASEGEVLETEMESVEIEKGERETGSGEDTRLCGHTNEAWAEVAAAVVIRMQAACVWQQCWETWNQFLEGRDYF